MFVLPRQVLGAWRLTEEYGRILIEAIIFKFGINVHSLFSWINTI